MRQNRHSGIFALKGKIDTAIFMNWAGYGPKFRSRYGLGYGFVVMGMGRYRSQKCEPVTSLVRTICINCNEKLSYKA